MKNKRGLKKKLSMLFVLAFIFMVLSMIVLFIDIEQNKGIVPFIFIFSTLFYAFSNYEYIITNNNLTFRTRKEKPSFFMIFLTILGILLSIIFFIISCYVFWV